MKEKFNFEIKDAKGKLGVMTPGLGAVSTTFIAGVLAIRKGIGQPIGSLTQMGRIRLGKRDEKRNPLINEIVPLANLDDIEFAAWDLFEDNAYEAAVKAGVLERTLVDQLKDELSAIKPMKAVFDKRWVKKLDGTYVKEAPTKYDLCEMLREDIRNFKSQNNLDRVVMIWSASTEIYQDYDPVYATKESFIKGMKENHPAIAPSMLYAWAAISEGVPYANGAPNLTADVPAMYAYADEMGVPLAGKDFKTGQTLMKTIVAPGLKARMLGLEGWFSTASFRTLLEKLRAADRPVKVAPICHFTMGGVAIDEWGQTDVEGLYAAGEVVGGVHGANRHGGNALTSALVFGARAGRRAAEYARETSAIKPSGFEEELQSYESLRGEGVEAEELLERLRRLMWSKVGILREGEELREALREIGELREEAEEVKAETRREMLQALELPMALETAEMICRSALMRTESRGAHYRVDYPEEDERWLRVIYLQKRGGEMRLHVEPLSSNA